MGIYRPNVTDKEQADIEAALNDSAIRIQSFDGKKEQLGKTKLIKAYDNQNSTNANGNPNNNRQFPGAIIGNWNDKPFVFENPGKIPVSVDVTALATATLEMTSTSPEINTGGSGYRDGDTIDLAGGTFSTRAVLTPLTFAMETLAVDEGGAGYTVGTNGELVGGTKSVTARFDIDTIGPAQFQDETDYDGLGSNGTFGIGNDGYAVSDVLTMSDGSTVRVDAIMDDGEIQTVSEFTVLTGATTGSASNNPALTQTGGPGNGFTMTLGNANQAVVTASINTAGNYTVLPANDVATIVEGTGSGLEFNVDWEILSASISVEGDYSEIPSNPVSQESSSGGGSGASFNIGWGVLAITVTKGGSGYDAVPGVTITGGIGATATASLTGGAVSSIAVDTPGGSFTSTATVTVDAP